MLSFSLFFTAGPVTKFRIIPSQRYFGPGEIAVVPDQLCSLTKCALNCFKFSMTCRLGVLNKENCDCILFDNNFYATSNKTEKNSDFDMITIVYYGT